MRRTSDNANILGLAFDYSRQLGPRLVLMVGGLMGSGKSTLAQQLGRHLAAEVISSDNVRQRAQFAPKPNRPVAFGRGRYARQDRIKNYAKLLTDAELALAKNDTVVLDASFTMAETRNMAAEFARTSGARLLQVECECPPAESVRRIEERCGDGKSSSEARPELHERQAATADGPLAGVPLVRIDTTMATSWQQNRVIDAVKELIRP